MKIGIYFDIENVIGTLQYKNMELNIPAIINYVKDKGKIAVMKAYGDLIMTAKRNKQFTLSYLREELSKELIHIEDIPYCSKNKNSADLTLALDCYNHAITKKIDTAIVVSDDKDFVPLFQKLAEEGIKVICIKINTLSYEETSSPYYTLIKYSSIAQVAEPQNETSDATSFALKKQKIRLEELLGLVVPTKSNIEDIVVNTLSKYTGEETLPPKKLLLSELATLVSKDAYPQNLVYRILLTLFYSNELFLTAKGTHNNPVILNIKEEITVSFLVDTAIQQLSLLYKKKYGEKLDANIFN